MDGEIVEVTFDDFASVYLPFNPQDSDVEATVNSMAPASRDPPPPVTPITETSTDQPVRRSTRPKAVGVVRKSEPEEEISILCHTPQGDVRFSDFPFPPISSSDKETEFYSPIQKISAAVVKGPAPAGRVRNSFAYLDCPRKSIDGRESNNFIDAAVARKQPASTQPSASPKTSDIALVAEYTLRVANALENANQAVSANVQIMNDDVRRMHCYGMTIESDQVRLWYHSRSHSAVSQPFSFVKEPKKLIKVLLSFLFATEEELGYDLKVTSVGDDYIFEMGSQTTPRFFRTQGPPLSEFRSSCITGRMTRVWKVVEVDSASKDAAVLRDGTPFVLKDVWIEESAMTERQVQQALFKDIEDYWRNVDVETEARLEKVHDTARELQAQVRSGEYKKWFLTIFLDYEGRRSRRLPKSARQRRGLLLKEGEVPPLASHSGTTRPLSQAESSNLPRLFAPKKQYRALIEEVCIPVGDIERLDQVFHVLDGAIRPLLLMFGARWIHRDISAGNILGHLQGSGAAPHYQTKLSDLEYARRYPPPVDYTAGGDPKTGTPFFMACEILLGAPLWLFNENADIEAIREMIDNRAGSSAPVEDLEVVPHHLHDLESIWWIAAWSILSRVPDSTANTYSRTIFINAIRQAPSSERIKLFTLGKLKDNVPQGRCLDGAATELTKLGRALRSLYGLHTTSWVTYGQDSEQVVEIYVSGFEFFIKVFGSLLQEVPALSLTTCGDRNIAQSSAPRSKRCRPKDDDEYQPGAGDSNAPSGSGKGAKRSKTRNKSGSGSKSRTSTCQMA
ncbi:other/FunK1 protein kinase [Coprinopsis cinerea okayama7|uniref:Other/FunK1 protein kinase n=1 Tax=Coprinopsis cinerea (strain Okayama-7 / 130 / ATCC MYA-4618 / FGSC 9003) TaxID=240176 RepID=A8NK09_COPC7|nr:other/FunK1 protein kinase [Coprinopsis cinerea okayama7\|eukprot:XP_001834506.2 other/FunK1 protein kinase [Coprinopsis cinerea okayama7\